MVAMTGGRGPAMTGGPGYIREARHRIVSRAAASPKRHSRCCSRRARIRMRKGPTAIRCSIRRRAPAISR